METIAFMKLFTCPNCQKTLYFRNLICSCGTEVSYDPAQERFLTGVATCSNRADISCNWRATENGYCQSCNMTEIIPDTFRLKNIALWADAETAKRWVLANLGRWGWFTASDAGTRPRFHLLSEKTRRGSEHIIMGHDDGLITINVTEADPAQRAKRREELSERLRTMTAHFRHEIAHFLFVRLSESPAFLAAFRELFGDETTDYGEALDRHYKNGAPANYEINHVTRYASSHPHEDWAETVAHMLHLTDIVDSASATGLDKDGVPARGYDAYRETEGEALILQAVELGLALNHVNRSMGLQDLYPFVISANVRSKLIFAHRHVSSALAGEPARQKPRRFGIF